MELEETLTLVAGMGSFAAAAAIGIVYWLQYKLQKRSTSANVAMQIMATIRANKSLGELLRKLAVSLVQADDPQIPWFLASLDAIAIFWKEGTITDSHVREFIGSYLKQINDTPALQEFMNGIDESVYPSLRRLLTASKKWNI